MTSIASPFPHFTMKKEYFIIIPALCILIIGFSGMFHFDGFLNHSLSRPLFLPIISVLIFKALVCWLIKVIWPVISEYSKDQFENNFKSLTPWQKVRITLLFYMLLLFSFLASQAALN